MIAVSVLRPMIESPVEAVSPCALAGRGRNRGSDYRAFSLVRTDRQSALANERTPGCTQDRDTCSTVQFQLQATGRIGKSKGNENAPLHADGARTIPCLASKDTLPLSLQAWGKGGFPRNH